MLIYVVIVNGYSSANKLLRETQLPPPSNESMRRVRGGGGERESLKNVRYRYERTCIVFIFFFPVLRSKLNSNDDTLRTMTDD